MNRAPEIIVEEVATCETVPSLQTDDAIMSEEQRGRSAPPGVGPAFSPADAASQADLDGRDSPSSSFIDDNDMPPTKPGLWLLKTKAEARASTATVQAWTIELPSRAANTVLGYALLCLRAVLHLADFHMQSHQGQRSRPRCYRLAAHPSLCKGPLPAYPPHPRDHRRQPQQKWQRTSRRWLLSWLVSLTLIAQQTSG